MDKGLTQKTRVQPNLHNLRSPDTPWWLFYIIANSTEKHRVQAVAHDLETARNFLACVADSEHTAGKLYLAFHLSFE